MNKKKNEKRSGQEGNAGTCSKRKRNTRYNFMYYPGLETISLGPH